MAKEEKNETAEEGAEEGQAGEKKGGKNKLLLIIIVAVLVLAGGGGAAFFLLSGEPWEEVAGEESEKEEAIYYELYKPFVVNFDVNNRQRYLQARVSVMAREQEVIDAMDAHLPLIRNRLVMMFSAAKFADLQTNDGREALRQDALTALQDVLQNEIGKPGVEQVFFTGFVMQ